MNLRALVAERYFFDRILAQQLRVKTTDDWYRVTNLHSSKYGASFVSAKFNGSLFQTLTDIYPEHTWEPWRFVKVPQKYWNEKRNHKTVFEGVGKLLGVKTFNDWYDVAMKDFHQYGSEALMKYHYNYSLYRALREIYPEYDFVPYNFKHSPSNCWEELAHQKQKMDVMGRKFSIKILDEWYECNGSALRDVGEFSLICARYEGSYIKAVTSLYPKHPWKEWLFRSASQYCWNKIENVIAFLRDCELGMSIKKPSDWYRVSVSQLRDAHPCFSGFSRIFPDCLEQVYPHFNWDMTLFNSRSKKTLQRVLVSSVSALFKTKNEKKRKVKRLRRVKLEKRWVSASA